MLGQRYRLEEVMAQRRNIATWRAFDEVLSRSVVCHVLLPDDPRTERVMTAARKSAVATDSRFLRVLDAVQTLPDDTLSGGTGDPEIGSYVVCEYAPGQNLQTLLAGGPLTALEAAWVVREVADAMSGVHSAGLYHQRLNPDTVIITPSGNIKIVGLLLEAALSTQPGALDTTDPAELRRGRLPGRPGSDHDAADDVADLGRLLYACLIQRWPGGNQWGLLAAPTDGHSSWLSPHQVRAGVSPALDRITDQILQEKPRSEPILTAHGVVNALTKVLGSADAAADLERRLRHPVPTVGAEVPASAGSPSTTFWAQQQPPVSPPTPPTNARPQHPGRRTPAALAGTAPARPPRRRWIGLLALIVVVAMLALLAVAVVTALRRNSSGAPPDSSSTPGGVLGGTAGRARTAPDQHRGQLRPRGRRRQRRREPRPGEERLRRQDVDAVAHADVQGQPEAGWPQTRRGPGARSRVGAAGQSGGAGAQRQRHRRRDPGPQERRGHHCAARRRGGLARGRPLRPGRVLGHPRPHQPTTTRFVLVYLTSLPADGSMFRGGDLRGQGARVIPESDRVDTDASTAEHRADAELLAAHVDGDPHAFAALVARHRDRLWAIALRTMRNPEEAADALQDAYISAFRKADSFRGEAMVTTWLHRVVVNACLDRLRRQQGAARRPAARRRRPDGRARPTGATGSIRSRPRSNEPSSPRRSARSTTTSGPLWCWWTWRATRSRRQREILGCAVGTIKSRCSRGRARLVPLLAHLRQPAG